MSYASIEGVVDTVAGLQQPGLIAIDGLPLSGKSTLADRLAAQLGFDVLYLDDFVLPERLWPAERTPRFPFAYIRYEEFMATIATLASTGEAAFRAFDWAALDTAAAPRTVRLDRPVIVEGVSALHPLLCRHYSLKIYVDSDRATTFAASLARGVGSWLSEWRDWFLPSADLYFASNPMSRADLIVAGRGIAPMAIPAGVSEKPLLRG